MHFGIIEYIANQEPVELCGSASRRGVVLTPGESGIRSTPSTYQTIYLVAVPARTAVFDIELPAPLTGRSLESALRFELEQLVPLSPDKVTWSYRRLIRDNRHFRICVTHLDEVRQILDKLSGTGLCCDCFLPAQLLLNPADSAAPKLDSPARLLLEYLPSDPGGRNLHLATEPIPRWLRPVRNRRLRLLHKTLLAVACALLGAILFVRFQQFSAEYRALRANRQALDRKLQESEAVSARLLQTRELARRIAEAKIGTASVLPILADLNERMPAQMHLASYQQTADQIDLVIVSPHDDPNLPRILLGSKLYQSDLRKTVQPDSQETTFNVTLRSLLP